MSFQLSPDQQLAVDGIVQVIENAPMNGSAAAVLTGFAGSGKTTTVMELMCALDGSGIPYQLAATTHKAAGVLADTTGTFVATVHKLFCLRPSITNAGVEIIKRTRDVVPIPKASVVIIDEASMISEKLLKAIAETAKDLHLRLVFVGDAYQLPPTKGRCTLFDGSLPTFRLTQIHRQAGGNPILDKADEFRQFIEGTRKSEPLIAQDVNAKDEGIHALSRKDFMKKFVEKYVDYDAGTEVDIPMCCFTNAKAITYNDAIRKATYFLTEDIVQPFYKGERMVSNSGCIQDGRTSLMNNEEVIIESFKEDIYDGLLHGYWVVVKLPNSNDINRQRVQVFCARSQDDLKEYKKALTDKVKSPEEYFTWPEYYDKINSVADLRPPFAGTTHKAQGGTFPSVFIDKIDIDKCRNPITRAKLMYVALTRARKNVYVLN